MNDLQAARLAAEVCLVEDRPLAEALQRFSPRAATLAAAGNLSDALAELRFEPALARLGLVRPAAVRRASEQLAGLPSPATLRVELVQTVGWFGFVALIQVAVLEVLSLKVLPVVARMLAESGLAWPGSSGSSGALLAVGAVVLGVAAGVGAVGPPWLPGWRRSLNQAREAALTAALVETTPPEDVLSGWLRGSALQLGGSAPVAADLTALAQSRAQRALEQMQRFVIVYRYCGYVVLSAVAVGITLDVYLGCAALAGTR